MSRPWIARVTHDEEGYPQWTCRDVYVLLGNDNFFDILDVQAQRGESFDIRPFVRRYLRRELSSLEESLERPAPLPVLNMLRGAVGLRPLSIARRYQGARRVAKRILELLSAQGFEWSQTYLVPSRRASSSPQRALSQRGASSTSAETRKPGQTKTRTRVREFRVALTGKYDLRRIKQSVQDLPLKRVERNFMWVHFRFVESAAAKIELDADRRCFDLEYRAGTSDKVWSAAQRGRRLIVSYGRRGATLRKTEKLFATKELATEALHRLVRQKQQKGYT